MAEPISIKFQVDNKAAKKGIEEVTAALEGVARASALSGSGSTAPALNIETNATEVAQEAEALAQTLENVNNAALTAQKALVLTVDFTQADNQANSLDSALAKAGDTAAQTAAKIREVSSAVSGGVVTLPTVETSSSIANLQEVENEADEAAAAITDADAHFPDLTTSTNEAVTNLDRVRITANATSQSITATAKEATRFVELTGSELEKTAESIRKNNIHISPQALDSFLELEKMAKRVKFAVDDLKSGDYKQTFIPNSSEIVNLKQAEELLDQIIEAQNLIRGDDDANYYQWERLGESATSAQKEINDLVESYYSLGDAQEAQADRQKAAEEKAAAKAAEAAEDYAHSQRLKTGSLDELELALEEYEAALAEAQAQEDKAASAKFQKRIDSTKQAIDRQTKSTERARIAEQRRNAEILRSGSILERITSEIAAATIDAGTAQQAAGVKAGFFSRAMTGAAAAVRGFGVAIKTSLGPVGIILLAIELATLGIAKAWDKLTSLFTSGSKASEEQSKALAEQAKEMGRLADEAKRAADEIEQSQRREAEERQFLGVLEKVTEEYKSQTSEIEKQLRLKKYGLEDEAREIEFRRDLKKEELQLQAIREEWSDRQLEVALRTNELDRMRELEAITLRVSEAELQAANERVKIAQENARATAEASGGSPLIGSREQLTAIGSNAVKELQRYNQALREKEEALMREREAYKLLELAKDGFDDSGDELKDEQFRQTEDLLNPLGFSKADILNLDDEELKEAYRSAAAYYNDIAKQTSTDTSAARAALGRTGIAFNSLVNDDGTIDINRARGDIDSRVNTGAETFERQIKAQEELDAAKAQRAEAERKNILEEARAERSRELNAKRVQVQDKKYQQEQEKAAKAKADAAELERRKAIYSGYNSEQLAQRVAKTEGQSGSLAQADNAAARAALEDRLEQEVNKITEDGKLTKQELTQINSILPRMEKLGLSAEMLAMVRQLRTIAEQQAQVSNMQRAELRALKQQLDRTERAVKQQAVGR